MLLQSRLLADTISIQDSVMAVTTIRDAVGVRPASSTSRAVTHSPVMATISEE